MTLALLGAVIGIRAALALTRLMAALLFGVSPTDPLTFTAIPMLLAGVALLAAGFRRAAPRAWIRWPRSGTSSARGAIAGEVRHARHRPRPPGTPSRPSVELMGNPISVSAGHSFRVETHTIARSRWRLR